jgi:hypothetical protein
MEIIELEAASFWKIWIRVEKCEEIMKICGNSEGAGALCWVFRERNENENVNDILWLRSRELKLYKIEIRKKG